MYSQAELLTLLGTIVAWCGAFVLAAILLYARREYGPNKSRTMGAILIDTSLGFAALVVVIAGLPLVRIVWPDVLPLPVSRLVNVGSLVGVIWFAVARLLVWLLKGDAGQTAPRPRGGIE